MSESSKTPLMVIFCEPNNATDNRVLDLLFNNAIQVAETGADICWFRESKSLVIPKWNQKPKPHHLRRILMYYGNDNVDQLLIEFGQHKLYSLSPNLASVIVELHNKALARDSCGALMAFGRNMGFWIKSKCQEDLSTLPVIFTMRNNPCHMMIASLYTDQIFEIDKDGNLVNLLS